MKNSLLVFFLDAVRYDYLDPKNTPFLYELLSKGISGPMRTILGFDGIAATIATGVYPDRHAVWTQYLRAVEDDCPFRWITPVSSPLGQFEKWVRSRFLRKALRISVLRASMAMSRIGLYPGAHDVPYDLLPFFSYSLRKKMYSKNAFSVPSVFDILRSNCLSILPVDRPAIGGDAAVVARALKAQSGNDIVFVRLMDLDEVAHSHGIDSVQRIQTLRRTDNAVREIVEHYRTTQDPYVLVFADHGMIRVRETFDVVRRISASGVRKEDYLVFLDSTMARFWGSERDLNRIADALGSDGRGTILTEDMLSRFRARVPRTRYGQLIYLMNPGILVFPSYYERYRPSKAMHGYDPATPGQDTVFILYHTTLHEKRLKYVNLVDIAPTILDVCNVANPGYFEGKSVMRA
jgi:predicted AlkP superfamily pyrophosphatase or phosphodiesterase